MLLRLPLTTPTRKAPLDLVHPSTDTKSDGSDQGLRSDRCGRFEDDVVSQERELVEQPACLPGLALRVEAFGEVAAAEVANRVVDQTGHVLGM